MAMTNAERQARWRERQKAKAGSRPLRNEDDWQLFRLAAAPIIKELIAEGKKVQAGIMPAIILVNARRMQKLVDTWPDLPLETKKQLPKKRTVT